MLGQAVGRDQKTVAKHTHDSIRGADGDASTKGDYMIEYVAYLMRDH